MPYGQTGVDDGSKWGAGTRETEDGVKVALGNRGMTVEAALQEWRAPVHV